jgi:hypothetical protein
VDQISDFYFSFFLLSNALVLSSETFSTHIQYGDYYGGYGMGGYGGYGMGGYGGYGYGGYGGGVSAEVSCFSPFHFFLI